MSAETRSLGRTPVFPGSAATEGAIAHVITESDPFGGAQRNTLLTLEGLVRDGYRTELVCGPGAGLIPRARALGIEVHVVSELVKPVRPWTDLRCVAVLGRLFRARRYGLVHTHSVKAGLLGRIAARIAGVPIVVHTFHGYPFQLGDDLRTRAYVAVERVVSRFTDGIVCVGEVLAREISDWGMAPADRIATIHSGIDLAAFRRSKEPEALREELGLRGAWPVVGCVGRLAEPKAQYFLVEAIARLRERFPSVRLLLIGGGEELRPRIDEAIRRLGVDREVLLLGERDDVADLLGIIDVYATCSTREGVGRALTEAMLAGAPVVATAVNGVPELVVHEDTGLLVAPRDPVALANQIERLADDPSLRSRLGSRAREHARELMDGDRMIAKIEHLYGELFSRKGDRRG